LPISYDDAVDLKKSVEDDYLERHSAHQRLRRYWHGHYWKQVESEATSVTSVFKDLITPASDVGPDIKLVHNVVQEVCVKYQTYLSVLPMIRMYVDPPQTNRSRAQRDRKERFLYGMWHGADMTSTMADQGWFLPLMGDCFHAAWPDIANTRVRSVVRSPEFAFPLPNFENSGSDAYIFCWKTRQSAAKRQFPKWSGNLRSGPVRRAVDRVVGRTGSDPEVEIMEYSDGNEWARWVEGEKTNGVAHQFGFNMFEHIKFINVPGEVWGHGAVEQSVNLNEMGNLYLSLMMHSAIDNVFPTMVLQDPYKLPEQIHRGAGAVIPVNAGGDVKYINVPGILGNQMAWGGEIERMIKQATSMPDVNFGQFKASIVTGKAINELQGAGTGSLIEMVQGVSLGRGLASWNEKAIFYGQTMFRDEQIPLFGLMRTTAADINPRQFAMTLKGRDLVGSPHNEVVFMPYLGMHEKVVVGLQMAGANLVSRQWQREQVGIPDSEAMEEEILGEAVQDAVLAAIVGTLQQQPTPEAAENVEKQALGYLAGGTSHPALGLGQGVPQGMLPAGMGTAPPAGPPPALPPGAPPPAPIPAPSTAGPSNIVTLQDAQIAFQGLEGIQGRVFLVGEIVARGKTDDDLEVAVTEPSDKEPISQQLTQYSGRLSFHLVDEQPSERFVEVTPGAAPQTGEPEDAKLAALLGG
jgi:hypothetical protein